MGRVVTNFEERLKWRNSEIRSMSNFLWFIRFERSVTENEDISQDLKELERDIKWELDRRTDPESLELRRKHFGA